MFHCTLSKADVIRLQRGGNRAIIEDRAQKGLYTAIWETLWNEGLRELDALKGKALALAYGDKLRSREERKKSRARRKKARSRKR
jgi:hypothetical protein